jgi:hypothetical protein
MLMPSPDPTPAPPAPLLSPAAVARIVEHMNDDHADAVLRYVRFLAGRLNATAARLVDLDPIAMRIETDFADGTTQVVSVAFPEALESAEDAHRVMVSMAKDARREEIRHRAMATAREFAENFQTVQLGTVDSGGTPDVSVAPAVWFAEEGVFYTYVSELSVHTANLQETQRASLMIIEDESAASQLLARRRLTFPVSAHFVDREAPEFRAPMEALKTKFGAVMNHLETMTDFHLVRLTPGTGRLVNGFGQAYNVAALDWTELSHVGDVGHGHQSTTKAQS